MGLMPLRSTLPEPVGCGRLKPGMPGGAPVGSAPGKPGGRPCGGGACAGSGCCGVCEGVEVAGRLAAARESERVHPSAGSWSDRSLTKSRKDCGNVWSGRHGVCAQRGRQQASGDGVAKRKEMRDDEQVAQSTLLGELGEARSQSLSGRGEESRRTKLGDGESALINFRLVLARPRLSQSQPPSTFTHGRRP